MYTYIVFFGFQSYHIIEIFTGQTTDGQKRLLNVKLIIIVITFVLE